MQNFKSCKVCKFSDENNKEIIDAVVDFMMEHYPGEDTYCKLSEFICSKVDCPVTEEEKLMQEYVALKEREQWRLRNPELHYV